MKAINKKEKKSKSKDLTPIKPVSLSAYNLINIFLLFDSKKETDNIKKILVENNFHSYSFTIIKKKNEFISKLNLIKPDVIVSSLKIQNLDCSEIINIAKDYNPFIPIIFVAPKGHEEKAIECLKNGASDYILKKNIKILPSTIIKVIDEKQILKERDNFQTDLVKNELKYRMLFENMNEGFALFKALYDEKNDVCDAIIVDINSAAEKTSGISKSKLIDGKLLELFPVSTKKWLKLINPVVKNCTTMTYETYSNDLGKYFRVIAYSPLKDHFATITTDITDEKKDESKAKFEEELNTAIINSLPGIFYLIKRDGSFLMWNKNFTKITGFSEEKVKNTNAFYLIAEEDRRAVQLSVFKTLKKGEANVVAKLLTLDGNKIPFYLTGVKIEINKEPCLLGVGIDISDLENAKEKIVQQEQLLRKVLETLPVGVWLTDEKGVITYGNQEGRKIWAGEKYVGIENYGEYRGWWIDSKKKIEAEEWALARAIRKGESSLNENVFIECFDGSCKTILNSAVPLFDDENKITGAIVVNQDISEVYQTQEKIKKLSLAVEQSPSIIIITDKEGNIEYVNPKFFNVTDYNQEELIGNHISIIGTEIHPPDYFKKMWRTILSGKIWKGVFCNKKKNGELFWTSASISPIFNNKGDITHFLSTQEDITEKRLIDEKIKKLSLAVEQSPSIIIITNPNGNIEYANQKFFDVTGYNEQEVIGKHSDFLKTNLTPNETFIDLELKMKEGVTWKGEFCNRKKNGEYYWVSTAISPLINDEGKIIQFISLQEDITEKKKALDNLKISEEKYRTLAEAAQDYIFIINRNFEIEYFNENCKQLFNKNLIINKYKLEDLFNEETLEGQKKSISAVFNTGNPLYIEREFKSDKKSFWLGTLLSPIKDSECNINSILGISRDITERKDLENKLRESETLYRSLVDTAQIGIALLNMDTKIIFANDFHAKIHGYNSPNDIIGKNGFDFIPEQDREKIAYIKRMLINKGHLNLVEFYSIRKDGTIFPTEASAVIINDEFGNPISILVIVQDISERKKAENELKESESKYRNIVNTAYDMIIVVNLDGTLQSVNHAFEKVTGFTAKEVIGKNINEFGVTEEFRTSLFKFFRSAKGQSCDPFEVKIKSKHKGFMTWELTTVPYIQEEKIVGVLGIARDISERKLLEEKLKESENLYRTLIENTSDGFSLTDIEGKILFANKAKAIMHGYNEQMEMIGLNGFDLFCPNVKEEAYLKMRELLDKRTLNNFEAKLIRKDGSCFHAEISAAVIKNIKGEPTGFVAVTHDISIRKKAEEEMILAKEKAEEMNRLKSSFLANMSHELRTPLIGILGFAEILSEYLTDTDLTEMCKTILRGGRRLSETLNLILNLSKIEANKLEIKFHLCDLTKLVAESIKLYEAMALKKNLEMIFEIKHDNLFSLIDERYLVEIMNNLINNAIKYTEKGKITVQLDRFKNEKDWVVVKVIDTGIGIKKENLQVIFDEFRQESEGINRAFEGTGLGLTITKKLTELMYGIIEAESEYGKGSTFTIKFPLAKSHSSVEKDEIIKDENQILNSEHSKKMESILIIDDDQITLSVCSKYAEGYYEADCCLSGEEGIEKAKEKKYDVVFMDINLGKGITGLDAIKILKEDEHYQTIPFVALTAYAMSGDKEKFIKAGCTHYISKPFIRKEFLDITKKALEDFKMKD